MSKRCDVHRASYDHHRDRCKIAETTGTQEGCTLAETAERRSSRKLQNMLVFQLLSDNVTDEVTRSQLLRISGPQAANGKSKKKNLTFLAKFHSKIVAALASESSPCRNSFHKPIISREILVREYARSVRIIRRTAAVCFSPSSGADEDYDHLPHTQLDKVTHAISREEFGPLYLVT
ncbi:uncharacterized protein LOC107303901 [Oryza brachyantha]|nr:uncharacterized protein LOC107303901 [Oryza brachyantha]